MHHMRCALRILDAIITILGRLIVVLTIGQVHSLSIHIACNLGGKPLPRGARRQNRNGVAKSEAETPG